MVIRDQQAWKALWEEMHTTMTPMPALPDVDFTREMIVGAFLGQKPTGGYSVRITRISQTAGGFQVDFKESRPSPDSIVTQALTQPYHLIVLSKHEGKIDFVAGR